MRIITPDELQQVAASLRRDLGEPDMVKDVPGMGTIEVWELDGGNVNFRNFSGSGGSGDWTIDFSKELKELLGFKRYHAKH